MKTTQAQRDGARRYHHRRQANGPDTVVAGLLIAYYGRCLCCGRQPPEVKLQRDHVVPVSKGGGNGLDNAQVLCRSCNLKKGTATVDYRPGKCAPPDYDEWWTARVRAAYAAIDWGFGPREAAGK